MVHSLLALYIHFLLKSEIIIFKRLEATSSIHPVTWSQHKSSPWHPWSARESFGRAGEIQPASTSENNSVLQQLCASYLVPTSRNVDFSADCKNRFLVDWREIFLKSLPEYCQVQSLMKNLTYSSNCLSERNIFQRSFPWPALFPHFKTQLCLTKAKWNSSVL